MQTHNLIQGSKEWHEFRVSHFGASEAAAMLGISPYMSRTELLHLKSTGEGREHSGFTKNLFQDGHKAEDLARQILELRGFDFYPVTCSLGGLSASCDGLTFDRSLAFEHKLYSDDLAGKVKSGLVPDHYMSQCQQILLITGADKLLFVCSDGTESRWEDIEVYPDAEWHCKINSGWIQFKIDLANFKQKVIAEKPDAEAIMQLPALSIQIKGEVTLSNLPQFKEAAETFIANINTNLATDEDFVNAEVTVKFCDEAEKKLEAAKAAAIGQTASIDELMRTIDFIKESIRSKRLTLEKLVKSQKEAIKDSIIKAGLELCHLHVGNIQNEFNRFDFSKLASSVFDTQNFAAVCKNKRTLESLHNAVDTEVASIKISLDDLARSVRKNLSHLPSDISLFRDLQSIITKPEDDFKLLVESRLAEQKRKEDESIQRAIDEAKAAEERAKAQVFEAQERERIAKENEENKRQEAIEIEKKLITYEERQRRVDAMMGEEKCTLDENHRSRIRNEAVQSLIDGGMTPLEAGIIIDLIERGEIKHVSINF